MTFDAAEVPAAARQLEARAYTFRDPAAERDVIDYFTALAELCAEDVIELSRTVKEATGGQRLAGAFYGYLLDLAWNGGFFKERPDSDYSTYHRSGHLGLKRVLASPHVDFLVSSLFVRIPGPGRATGGRLRCRKPPKCNKMKHLVRVCGIPRRRRSIAD